MGQWVNRRDCRQCLGLCSPDSTMINMWSDFVAQTSSDWRLEIIHDVADGSINGSVRDKWAKNHESWIVGLYKSGTEFAGLMFEILICDKGTGEKPYFKIKLEINECPFAKDKKSSNMLQDHRRSFLEHLEKRLLKKNWVVAQTRKDAKKSVSIMYADEDLGQVLELTQLVDKEGWL
jgi:hypothetical protein